MTCCGQSTCPREPRSSSGPGRGGDLQSALRQTISALVDPSMDTVDDLEQIRTALAHAKLRIDDLEGWLKANPEDMEDE